MPKRRVKAKDSSVKKVTRSTKKALNAKTDRLHKIISKIASKKAKLEGAKTSKAGQAAARVSQKVTRQTLLQRKWFTRSAAKMAEQNFSPSFLKRNLRKVTKKNQKSSITDKKLKHVFIKCGRSGNRSAASDPWMSMHPIGQLVHMVAPHLHRRRRVKDEETIPNYDEADPDAGDRNNFVGVDVALAPDHEGKECPVCLEPLKQNGPLKSTGKCEHVFHYTCISDVMKISNKCPVCREVAVENLGPCPNGTMHVSTISDDRCDGYDDCGVIEIRFESLLSYYSN